MKNLINFTIASIVLLTTENSVMWGGIALLIIINIKPIWKRN